MKSGALRILIDFLFLALAARGALAQSTTGGSGTAAPQTSSAPFDPGKDNAAEPKTPRAWDLHFQSTLVGQGVLPFSAQYSGTNSLEPHGEVKNTFSFDAVGNLRLWRGGEMFADVLAWQGYGLSKTTGVAAFPNGEAFRIGKKFPDASVVRAYLQQTILLGGNQDPGAGSAAPAGQKDSRKIVLTVGHFSVTDIFDKNAYAGDARTQFMNWALISNVAWDYPANTLGFTNGAAAELDLNSWAARVGVFQVSRFANAIRMDWNVGQANSLVAEVERQLSIATHPGALRLLAYRQQAHMGSYQEALGNPADIQANGQLGYKTKYGFGLNAEQEISKDVGAFMRLGWSDGKNETWEFTDVDRTGSLGLSMKGEMWRRPGDTAGVAAVIDGISAVHRQFLAAGGLGVTVGDGALDYRAERLGEAYYNWKVANHFDFTMDYQLAVNPGYNRVRGPANILATRLHWEY